MNALRIEPAEYVSGGYYVSVDAGAVDCTGTRLRPTTMAHDHTQRRFFPDCWAVRWTGVSDDERAAEASLLGIPSAKLEAALDWATASFGSRIGAWSTCFELDTARWVQTELFARRAAQVWGIGLHASLVERFTRLHEPVQQPGYAPSGRGGVQAALSRAEPIEPGGAHLGFEVLTYDDRVSLQSLASLHADEAGLLAQAGATATPRGLCADLDAAHRVSALADSRTSHVWFPWLLTEYAERRSPDPPPGSGSLRHRA